MDQQILLYFFFNGIGFLFFLFVWNRLPKVRFDRLWRRMFPKPFDYTTVPGLKLEVSSAEQIPPLSIEPGIPLSSISSTQGNLDEIKRFPHHRQFLEYLRLCFSSLNSFYWGPRYVVAVSSLELLKELASYKENLVAACPLAFASILNGDERFWNKSPNDSLVIEGPSEKIKLNPMLVEKRQNKLFLSGPQNLQEESDIDVTEAIRQVPLAFREDICSSKSIREILSRPLTIVFNKEIELDAHPIPKFVPIIIHVGGIIQKWPTEELWKKYYEELSWVPGIDMLKTVEHDITAKIRRESTKRDR